MLKKKARKHFKAKRTALSQDEIAAKSIEIANQLLKIKGLFDEENVYFHLFLSIASQNEIDTEPILNILFAKNKEVVVSKSNFETCSLTNYLLTENTRILANEYGIPEPQDGLEVPAKKIAVVFVPLLACDMTGNRVGYGKGFYDRFLKNTDAIKIGLSFFEPVQKITDISLDDIALNYCVTPDKVYSF